MSEDVNHPQHYCSHPSGVECIQITEHMNFCMGNALKYLWRAGLKTDDPIKDLKKAVWYLEREIQRLQPNETTLAAIKDSHGWIKWEGGENPVPGKKVEARLHDGRLAFDGVCPSDGCWWGRDSKKLATYDIVAYRVVD